MVLKSLLDDGIRSVPADRVDAASQFIEDSLAAAEKIESLQNSVSNAIERVVLPARHIARVIEKIISLSIAVGPVSRLMTRSLYAVLDNREY